MYDVVTFGSVSFDSLLKIKKRDFIIEKSKLSPSGRIIGFPLGMKLKIKDLEVFVGGGGTNTAFTFLRQGFNTAYVGKVGDDILGERIIKFLEENGLRTFIRKEKRVSTEYSVIFSTKGGEKTILVFRGAASSLTEKDIPWEKINARWFYVAPLSGKSAKVFQKIVNFAQKKRIKVALNPSIDQISLFRANISYRRFLKMVNLLILNREESLLLTSKKKTGDVFKRLIEFSSQKTIIVITEGEKGSKVYSQGCIFEIRAPKVKTLDKTGAGDAFGSGFLVGLLRKNNIEYAIKLATSNATSCIKVPGAKNGLLRKGQRLYNIKVKKIKFL